MKSIIKKILPSTWVGVLANTFNKLNRLIIVPLFFHEYPSEKIKFVLNTSKKPIRSIFNEPEHAYRNLPSQVKKSFKEFTDVEQNEIIAEVEECLIEPKYGWPMTRSRALIYDCFPYSRQNIVPTPSPFSISNKKHREFNEIISFREIFEFGYWHFHTDIIHKNYLLAKYPSIDENVPLLISKELSTKPYFKFFYEQTDIFRNRNVIVQDNFLVSTKVAYFLKPMPHQPEYYKKTSEKVNSWKSEASLNRKIFLTRDASRGRFIANLKEIAPVLKKYGFEFIDAETLTIEEQIKLFSGTELLVGIHGAGLINMMFRWPRPMKMLEIFPNAQGRYQIPPHYFLLSGIFGFYYEALLGSGYVNKLMKTFFVDPLLLDAAIKRLIER